MPQQTKPGERCRQWSGGPSISAPNAKRFTACIGGATVKGATLSSPTPLEENVFQSFEDYNRGRYAEQNGLLGRRRSG